MQPLPTPHTAVTPQVTTQRGAANGVPWGSTVGTRVKREQGAVKSCLQESSHGP